MSNQNSKVIHGQFGLQYIHMHVVRALDVAHPANPGTKANIISWFSSISTISLLSPWSFHLLPSPCSCLCWGHHPYPCRGPGCRSLLSPLVSFHSSWQQLWSVHGGILSFLPAHFISPQRCLREQQIYQITSFPGLGRSFFQWFVGEKLLKVHSHPNGNPWAGLCNAQPMLSFY